MAKYDEASIKSLDWKEHIRRRPGMYIGKLGDGSSPDDGIYVLVKEVIDNSIDEFVMGNGKRIDVEITDDSVIIRDYGRGVPHGKLVDCVSKMNTGAKYDSEVFQKSVGLNGVGTKAVNALSEKFKITSYREGKYKEANFEKGELIKESKVHSSSKPEKDGTQVEFTPDKTLFKGYKFRTAFLENLLWNYAYLNSGLKIFCNGKEYSSQKGLFDLLTAKVEADDIRYPIMHFKGPDIEISMTHAGSSSEEYYSFVNGQYTTQGGTHQAAMRESLVKVLREFYKKSYEPQDIRSGIIVAISVRVQEPVFESQTKTKLGSLTMSPVTEGAEDASKTIRSFVNDFLAKELDNYLHKNKATAEALLKRIVEAERERTELVGIQKLARERTKKANIFNKKLRDCKAHFNTKDVKGEDSMIFITEGDSASGSITTSRDVDVQAVFSLRGKPLNTYGMKKKIVYENEEFNLLQHALNLEEGIEGLRYNKVIIATDADVDGMHIRLLLLTFFLQYFPELIKGGHVAILKTPLFRVRNTKETIYCYSEEEKLEAYKKISEKGRETTRFKGLGEISPDEFPQFIGNEIRLEAVNYLADEKSIHQTLRFYMGKNTPDRQEFIIENLLSDLLV